MARVQYRKARKDYPAAGVAKGDMYYYVKIKTGPRSSQEIRSKDPIPASRLTTSSFKSAWLGVQEEWERSEKDAEAIAAAAEAIRDAGQEARESFDNMPEGLQQGQTGEMLETRAGTAEEAADALDALAEDLNGLTEPDEIEEPDDPEDEDQNEAFEQWQEESDHYQSELARIAEEADSLIGDMPE